MCACDSARMCACMYMFVFVCMCMWALVCVFAMVACLCRKGLGLCSSV